MAAGNSSSRRKSSSSHKKKRSKTSAEVRRRRSRSRTRNKSKKPHRRDVSLSYSDTDSKSENSVSISSTDSECYRSRKARSRTRGDLKSRKRVRRSLSSCGGSRESPHQNRKKDSKQNGGSKAKKKTHQRKHVHKYSKRDMNVNSESSGSWSCSTCGSESSSSRGSDFSRVRPQKRGKNKRSKMSNGKSKGRYRSRSSSSCSGCCNRSGYQSEERWAGGNDLGCLKSVLAVTNRSKEKEERHRSNDENKADIIQAYDDCPSCRSNDSLEGGRKRESTYHPYVSYKRWEDNSRDEEAFISKIRTTEETSKEEGRVQYGRTTHISGEIGSTDSLMGSKDEISSGSGIPESDYLESFLRQKALENLRKFRRGPQSNTTSSNDKKDGIVNKQSLTSKVESVEMGSRKEDGKSVSISKMERQSTSSSKNDGRTTVFGIKQPLTSKVEPIESKKKENGVVCAIKEATSNVKTLSTPTMERKPTSSSQKNGNYNGHGSRTKVAVSSKPTENNKYTVSASDNMSTSTQKQELASLEFSTGNLLEAENFNDKNTETPKIAFRNTINTNVEVNKPPCGSTTMPETTCLNPVIGENGSDEPQREAKDGSQYEQKTMSVMRGGEMVQVSYKVYIPKKTPALARRQLKR